MSGTSYGACILHVAQKQPLEVPWACERRGHHRIGCFERRLELLVDPNELERRRQEWQAPTAKHRKVMLLYIEQVTQADEGCDFKFTKVLRRNNRQIF